MIFAVINFIYTVTVKPYSENNATEIMNETTILLCAYLTNTFMQCDNVKFSTTIGWVFIGIQG